MLFSTMYLLNRLSKTSTIVTVMPDSDFNLRVVNSDFVFGGEPVDPITLVPTSPDMKVHIKPGDTDPIWYLCETAEDVDRLLNKTSFDIGYLYVRRSGTATVIPVFINLDDENNAIHVISKIIDESPYANAQNAEFFAKIQHLDEDGNAYHAPANFDDDSIRLYEKLDSADAAVHRYKLLNDILDSLKLNPYSINTRTLDSIQDVLTRRNLELKKDPEQEQKE